MINIATVANHARDSHNILEQIEMFQEKYSKLIMCSMTNIIEFILNKWERYIDEYRKKCGEFGNDIIEKNDICSYIKTVEKILFKILGGYRG